MRASLSISDRRGERGAVLVIAAAFMVVAVIFLGFVVDLGGQRADKRELTLSTDAAALAGAAVADLNDSDLATLNTPKSCSLIAIDLTAPNASSYANVDAAVKDYISRNGGDGTIIDCKVVRTGSKAGYVLVSDSEIVKYPIGTSFGQASGQVAGVSVAAIESDPGGGLRPNGICATTSSLDNPAYSVPALIAQAGAGSPTATLNGGSGVVVTFPLEKLKNTNQGCGSADGNFGQLDYDGGNNSGSCNQNGSFCYNWENGYYGTVTNPTPGDPGNNYNSSTGAMDALIASQQRFWVPVYTSVTSSGNNASFTLTKFMEVQFVAYCHQNNCRITHSDGEKYRYFRWRVLRFADYAASGPPPTADAAKFPPRICSVSGSTSEIAANCQ